MAVENKGVVIADGVGVGAGVESHRDLFIVVVVVEVLDVGARGVSFDVWDVTAGVASMEVAVDVMGVSSHRFRN